MILKLLLTPIYLKDLKYMLLVLHFLKCKTLYSLVEEIAFFNDQKNPYLCIFIDTFEYNLLESDYKVTIGDKITTKEMLEVVKDKEGLLELYNGST